MICFFPLPPNSPLTRQDQASPSNSSSGQRLVLATLPWSPRRATSGHSVAMMTVSLARGHVPRFLSALPGLHRSAANTAMAWLRVDPIIRWVGIILSFSHDTSKVGYHETFLPRNMSRVVMYSKNTDRDSVFFKNRIWIALFPCKQPTPSCNSSKVGYHKTFLPRNTSRAIMYSKDTERHFVFFKTLIRTKLFPSSSCYCVTTAMASSSQLNWHSPLGL